MIEISGQIDRVNYLNPENHYTITRFKPDDRKTLITVVGCLPGVSTGETLKLSGNWETHPKFGDQFKAQTFEVLLPTTVSGIRKYLGSGIIKGIGPAMARRITDEFKSDALDIIENEPEKLKQVQGIGKSRVSEINEAWQTHHATRNLIHFLQENGVDASTGAAILKEYGSSALELIKNNPYIIAGGMASDGFSIADTIGKNLGIPPDDLERRKACIIHCMDLNENNGDSFFPEDQLLLRCSVLLRHEISHELVGEAIEALIENKNLIRDDNFDLCAVYKKELYDAERGIAEKTQALLSVPVRDAGLATAQILEEIVNKLAIKLSQEQLEVLEEVLTRKVAIITGGPGTGKTTLVRSITALLNSMGKKILLAAPTGRAARRLSEVTGKKASTIHKLLQYNQITGSFDKNRDDPLVTDTLIVDEASMIDTRLMNHLLSATPLTASLILVGDTFQLPSIGPGNVLSDMIDSKKVETFQLTKIFRQAKESPIVVNAHMVRNLGPEEVHLDFKSAHDDDGLSVFYFFERNDPREAVKTILNLCTKKIPDRFPHLKKNIQVLTPMHKGEVGTINLNQVLQEALNPGMDAVKGMGCSFRMDDKVMHLKNNYKKDVFNGDIGKISAIDKKNEQLEVNYDGRIVDYDFSELDELTLAYAISVHKSQGSEYPAVIIPIMAQHRPLLQRNLLYTAMTRGKALVILIGTRQAVNTALGNNRSQHRLSYLDKRL